MLERANSWTERGIKQTKSWSRRGRVNAQLFRLGRQVEQQYAQLGRAVYPMLLDGSVQLPTNSSDVRFAVERINALAADADRKRGQASSVEDREVGEPHGEETASSESIFDGSGAGSTH